MTTYRPFQTLHPLSLLAQMSSRQTTGCLKVSTEQGAWLLYLEQGKLNYATTSSQAFDRLDLHLRRLNSQVPALVSAVRVQVRLLFEKADTSLDFCPDYQAICWLVDQQHLHSNQALTLIENLAKEVLEGFLELREGISELIETDFLMGLPRLAQLNLRPLVEDCYGRLKQRQTPRPPASVAPDLLQRNGNYQPATAYPSSPATTANSPALTTPALTTLAPEVPSRAAIKTTYTIACIDDSPTVLAAINQFLDDKMFSVLMISDPVKALMQVMRNKPDLILLDVTMPNLDGYELCSLLRRHPDFKNVPIIMVTSNTGLIDRAKAKLVRASGYLTKPFNQSDLLKIIFKHLS